MRKVKNLESGRFGEQLIADYLKSKGFEILQRNYHSRYGEIDIVARDDVYILFVEVKLRRANGMVHPSEAVNAAKMKRILKTAESFLLNFELVRALQPRFDVAEVVTNAGTATINYIESAFDGELLEMGVAD
ncbi:MAG: YraN family protein [Oscillospiraceae bacterium]|jgi:putative endonuclease|nr:YraN family protein [Oscillospiraceae bacterium]